MTEDPKLDGPQMPEPVAWRTFDGEGGYDYRSYEDNEGYRAGVYVGPKFGCIHWAKRAQSPTQPADPTASGA